MLGSFRIAFLVLVIHGAFMAGSKSALAFPSNDDVCVVPERAIVRYERCASLLLSRARAKSLND